MLFLVVFGAASAGVIGYLYWQTSGYMARSVDAALGVQLDRWSQLAPDALQREVRSRTQKDPNGREPAALFSGAGERLAGSIDGVHRIIRYDAPFDMRQPGGSGGERPLRAVARVLDSGQVLVVAQDIHAMREFDEVLRHAIVGAALLIFPAGLLGAMALGRAATRRLDDTTRAIERIMAGRLDERLPVHGTLDDVDRLAQVVNGMLDEIERLLHEVKGVTDDVAHDLRTPLTRMLAGLERAQARVLSSEEYAEIVDRTSEQAKLLLRLFQALLTISDIENRTDRSDFEVVALDRVVADAVELFEPAAEERQLTFRLELAPEPVAIMGNRDLLFNAVSNLLDNAVKFTPSGGEIGVGLRVSGHEFVLEVVDNGPGIPLEEREAVLRRFYRAERSRRTPGNGLGLSLVAAIARRHGLRVRIDDAAPGCVISLQGASLHAASHAPGLAPAP
ncbi:MAG: HAMP domain-containing histidine kinase [Variovorax sp.]|nr:HAMP domain-containing histidine kinase [Variovorax sp.]